jgi:hypothetical protein
LANHAPLDRLEALVAEAERAFAGQPKALWSDRTYLAPKDARALRDLLTAVGAMERRSPPDGPGA